MKYLKLFENFNEDPDMDDALQIVITHLGEVDEDEINPIWGKDILKLELRERPTETQIKECEEHLRGWNEGFFLHLGTWPGDSEDNNDKKYPIIVGVGNSIEDYCINWLNNRFDDLIEIEQIISKFEKYIIGPKTFYIDRNNKPLFYFYKSIELIDGALSTYYISTDKIYLFFKGILDLSAEFTDEITKRWLIDKYGLKANSLFWVNYLSMAETFEKSCEKPII